MKRTAISACIIAGFSAMLVGTSEEKPLPSGPMPPAVVPSSTEWAVVTLPRARVAIRIPPGATVAVERSGTEGGAPGDFTVVMKSGYRVRVRSGGDGFSALAAVDDAKERHRGDVYAGTLYEAEDAIVATRSRAIGVVTEVTACAWAGTTHECVEAAGAEVDAENSIKLSPAECLEVVAMLRSLEGAT